MYPLSPVTILADGPIAITPNFNNPFAKLVAAITGHAQGAAIQFFILLLVVGGLAWGVSKFAGNQRGQHIGIGGLAVGLGGLLVVLIAPTITNWIYNNDELSNVSQPLPAVVQVVDTPTYEF